MEYRETLNELEKVASGQKRAFLESIHNSSYDGLRDRVEVFAGDAEMTSADFHSEVEQPLEVLTEKAYDLIDVALTMGFTDQQLSHIYRYIQITVQNALAIINSTRVERGGKPPLTIQQLQLDSFVESYVKMQAILAGADFTPVKSHIRALSAHPALLVAQDFAQEIHDVKVSHPELLETPQTDPNAALSPKDVADIKKLAPAGKADWVSATALTKLSEKVQYKEEVAGTDITIEEGKKLSGTQVRNLESLRDTLVELQEAHETNDDVYADRGLTHFAAHPDRADQILGVVNQILEANESLDRPEHSDPTFRDWQETIRQIRVDGRPISELIDLINGTVTEADREIIRHLISKLEDQSNAVLTMREDMGTTVAQKDSRVKRRNDWLDALVERARIALTSAESGTLLENREHQLFFRFLEAYGLDADGNPLSREIIYGTSKSADEERHRAVVRWIVSIWGQISDWPVPFLNMDLMKYPLSSLGPEFEFVHLADTVPKGTALYRFFFGVLKVVAMGAEAYKNQQNVTKLAEVYNERTNRLQLIEHILKTGPMGTGSLPMGSYIRFALQAIIMHDPADREQYRPVLESYLGEDELNILFPPGVDYPKYPQESRNGFTLDDLLVQENAKNSSVDINAMVKKLIEFVQAEDRRHGDPGNPLSEDDARFAVNAALNTSEFFQITAALDNKSYVSKRFTTRLKFFKEYRASKGREKQLGSIRTIHFFRTLQPEITEWLVSRGLDLENIIMMTGALDGHPDMQEKYLMKRPPELAADLGGEIVTLENMEIRKEEHWKMAPYEFGQMYVRLNGFTKKFYDIITWEEQMIKDWFSSHLSENQALRKIHNDKVGYYFGDFEKDPEKTQEDGETDAAFYARVRVERERWANKGYVLVKGYKVDPDNPGFYLDKRGNSTSDMSKAKVTWAYTPALTYFNYFHREGISAEELIDESMDHPEEFQARIEEKFTKDAFTRMRLGFTKWLVINEIAQKAHEFHEKDKADRIKIVDQIFACLVQDVFSHSYLTPSKVMSGVADHVEPAGFGKFTVDDVVEILEEAEWLRPGLIDSQIRIHIDTSIRPKVAAVRLAGLRPRIHA